MKPKENTGNPVQGQGIHSGDLLTSDQMNNQPPQQPIATTIPQQNMGSPIPDLHTTEQLPNAERRAQINQKVDQTMNKIDTVEDRIRRDVAEAQKTKFQGAPKNPKEVLKQLISKGEHTEDFDIFGHKWTLRALDQGDTLLSLDEVKDTLSTQSGRVMSVMFGTIIYSLEAIDDVSVYEWFEDIKLSDFNMNRMEYHVAVRRALRAYLEALPPNVIDILYEKYLEMEERRGAAIEELKNS